MSSYLDYEGLSLYHENNKNYIDGKIPTKTSDLTNDNNFVNTNTLNTSLNTKAPKEHTHEISDVDGLQDELNNYASKTDIPTLVAGNNITLTPNADSNEITISSTGGSETTPVTYELSKSDSTITLTGSDGTTSSVTDSNTTYSVATTSKNGLMSSTDKAKLDNTNIAYATCSTANATSAKVATISGNSNWTLKVGSIIVVKFTVTNTASSVTLNVNNTGAKSIWYNNAVYTGNSNAVCGYANRYTTYMYDGTNWVWISNGTDNNTTSFNNVLPVSTGNSTYTTLADFWTHCDSVFKSTNSKIMMGRAKLNTFTPNPNGGWFRYIASAQNTLGNGSHDIAGSLFLFDANDVWYATITGGITDSSDLAITWSTLGGKSYCSATIYSSTEPTSNLTKNLIWIG